MTEIYWRHKSRTITEKKLKKFLKGILLFDCKFVIYIATSVDDNINNNNNTQ